MNKINAIVLAAGEGRRMHSTKPKVLQTLADKTLLEHVLTQVRPLCSKVYVVYGFAGKQVKEAINDSSIHWVEQAEQLGTGHAAGQAIVHTQDDSTSLILYGDVPLITQATLISLVKQAQKNDIALLSTVLDKPTGYGRIIRKNKQICAVVEERDANNKQRAICEVNTGIMAINSGLLKTFLKRLSTNNAQSEFYLTDIIAMAADESKTIVSVITTNEAEVAGVNDKMQLAQLERTLQHNQAKQFMQQGLSLKDPMRFDCRGSLNFGKDCEIDINVVIEGEVTLGNGTTIAANCSIKNAKIGNNVSILANSVIEGADISRGASIGPFARIRPDTRIGENAKIGNFVEVKKSTIGADSKISHLSYVGDCTVGSAVNIGAGVIVCNYDGTKKHHTIIDDGAFIGSGSQIVAPLRIGKNATIGAGSTITKYVPDNHLSLTRVQQISLKNRKKPSKNK